MEEIKSVADLIGRFGKVAQFARDVGVTPLVASAWKRRDTIPAEHWSRIIAAAAANGIEGITTDLLTELAARPYQPRKAGDRIAAA